LFEIEQRTKQMQQTYYSFILVPILKMKLC